MFYVGQIVRWCGRVHIVNARYAYLDPDTQEVSYWYFISNVSDPVSECNLEAVGDE